MVVVPWQRCCSIYYRPQTKFGESNVFTSVCQEFCPQLMTATETRMVGKRAVCILLECFLADIQIIENTQMLKLKQHENIILLLVMKSAFLVWHVKLTALVQAVTSRGLLWGEIEQFEATYVHKRLGRLHDSHNACYCYSFNFRIKQPLPQWWK